MSAAEDSRPEIVGPRPRHRADVSPTTATLRQYVAQRDWAKLHSPEILAKNISVEAGELLKHFRWGDGFDAAGVQEELAEVLTYCHLLADKLGLDPEQIVLENLAVPVQVSPVHRAWRHRA